MIDLSRYGIGGAPGGPWKPGELADFPLPNPHQTALAFLNNEIVIVRIQRWKVGGVLEMRHTTIYQTSPATIHDVVAAPYNDTTLAGAIRHVAP